MGPGPTLQAAPKLGLCTPHSAATHKWPLPQHTALFRTGRTAADLAFFFSFLFQPVDLRLLHTTLFTHHRYLRDVGRSVSAYGYWGEIINPPYHAFGTTSSDHALFKVVNKQFSHTAVDVAEHNVMVSSGEVLQQLAAAHAVVASGL